MFRPYWNPSACQYEIRWHNLYLTMCLITSTWHIAASITSYRDRRWPQPDSHWFEGSDPLPRKERKRSALRKWANQSVLPRPRGLDVARTPQSGRVARQSRATRSRTQRHVGDQTRASPRPSSCSAKRPNVAYLPAHTSRRNGRPTHGGRLLTWRSRRFWVHWKRSRPPATTSPATVRAASSLGERPCTGRARGTRWVGQQNCPTSQLRTHLQRLRGFYS